MKMKPYQMKPFRAPHMGAPSRHYAKPPSDTMNTAVKGIVDVATIGMMGGVMIGALNAIPKK
jgi:hypothetical protein